MCVDVNLPYSMHTPYFIAHISYTYRPVMRAYAGTGGYEKMCVCVPGNMCPQCVCVCLPVPTCMYLWELSIICFNAYRRT